MASRGFCAPLSHISLTKSVLGQICCFSRLLRSASGNARPGFLAALAEILRTADQFCPETLLTVVRTASANVVELPPACCRIDKETPVQLVSFGHSGHGITSFLFLASIYRHRLLLCFASAEHQVRSLPGSFTPASLRSSARLRLRRVVSSPDVRYSVVKVRRPFEESPQVVEHRKEQTVVAPKYFFWLFLLLSYGRTWKDGFYKGRQDF